MQTFKRFLPLIGFVVVLVTMQNWWRIDLAMNPIQHEAIVDRDITLYSTSWCPYCVKARQYLLRAGIPFKEYDIEKSARAYQQYQQISGSGVPVLQIGRQTVQGFDREAIRGAVVQLAADKQAIMEQH